MKKLRNCLFTICHLLIYLRKTPFSRKRHLAEVSKDTGSPNWQQTSCRSNRSTHLVQILTLCGHPASGYIGHCKITTDSSAVVTNFTPNTRRKTLEIVRKTNLRSSPVTNGRKINIPSARWRHGRSQTQGNAIRLTQKLQCLTYYVTFIIFFKEIHIKMYICLIGNVGFFKTFI